MRFLPGKAYSYVYYFYTHYPARTISFLASAVVFAALKAGIVLPEVEVAKAITAIVPILLGGQAIHDRVTPVS